VKLGAGSDFGFSNGVAPIQLSSAVAHLNQLGGSTGYELHGSSQRLKELSYPTCARDLYHVRRVWESIFAIRPVNTVVLPHES
jgi:hypothetical protein